MNSNGENVDVLRDLAQQYAEIAAKPIQEERRELWRTHFSLQKTRAPILVTCGMHDAWCRETFSRDHMVLEDPFWRRYERWLRLQIFHDSIGDDYICEPWIPQSAVHRTRGGVFGESWGARLGLDFAGDTSGAYKLRPHISSWEDMATLTAPDHEIDEDATRSNYERLGDVIGDILTIDVNRGPLLSNFSADISTTVAGLRGLEQVMLDMYDEPIRLQELLSFLRDGVLANQEKAEKSGDFSLTCHSNQSMSYAGELEPPKPNSGTRQRKELWGFFAAQEYTGVSPEFHDEFLLQYQMPIMAPYGLVHYGCCEDLTRKIDMLRQVPNLRSIAVTPSADVAACANQIGNDYVMSWRPNPTDMVCTDWDPERVERIIRAGVSACRDNVFHIHLKDSHTLQGEPDRLQRWTTLVRDVVEAA
jgi:hypothetical protein|tara:strand:+ start:77 stop:1330 length:1254 start_codon:yes stop_codon:yes gene_type:complete